MSKPNLSNLGLVQTSGKTSVHCKHKLFTVQCRTLPLLLDARVRVGARGLGFKVSILTLALPKPNLMLGLGLGLELGQGWS